MQITADDWPLLLQVVLDLGVTSAQLQELQWRSFVALLLDEFLHVEDLGVLSDKLVPVALQLVSLPPDYLAHVLQGVCENRCNLLLDRLCVFFDLGHFLLHQRQLVLNDFLLLIQRHVLSSAFVVGNSEGLLYWNCAVLTLCSLDVCHDALTAERLRALVGIELVHFVVFRAEAEVFRFRLDRHGLVLAEELHPRPGMGLVVMLPAEVLSVIDAVHFGSLSADCALLDVALSILVERIDADLGLHHVEQAHLVTVVYPVRMLELSRCLLPAYVLEKDGVETWRHFPGCFAFIAIFSDWTHVGSSSCNLEEEERV